MQADDPNPQEASAAPRESAPETPGEPAEAPDSKERDKRIAEELTRRGVPPDEIARLLKKDDPALAALKQADKKKTNAPRPAPALEIPPSEPITPKPTITLPPPREATPADRVEADRLLTACNLARRRGNFKEAEKACREAIERTPGDAAALEIYGDILQAVGRVDDALYAYHHATEADPRRKTAERKYAELMLLQNREIRLLQGEDIPRNPFVAILLSVIFPGAGQVYNGEASKGLFIAATVLICGLILFWTPLGFPGAHRGVPASVVLFLLLATAAYIYAIIDANLSARGGRRGKSGWDV